MIFNTNPPMSSSPSIAVCLVPCSNSWNRQLLGGEGRRMSTSSHRRTVLSLYRAILRTHKKKLPYHLREIGDAYVKEEWRAHKKAKPEHVVQFLRQWTVRSPSHLQVQCLTLQRIICSHWRNNELWPAQIWMRYNRILNSIGNDSFWFRRKLNLYRQSSDSGSRT